MWTLERATQPALEGQALPCALHRVDAARARVGEIERSLSAEQVREASALLQCLSLGVGHQVHDTAASAVRVGTAEALHVDLLARDGTDHLGPRHEDPPLRTEDDDVGQGRAGTLVGHHFGIDARLRLQNFDRQVPGLEVDVQKVGNFQLSPG